MPTIVTSAVLNAPPAEVWPLLRDFAAIGSWHPYLPPAEIKDGPADEDKVSSQVEEGIFLPGLAALTERFAAGRPTARRTTEEA